MEKMDLLSGVAAGVVPSVITLFGRRFLKGTFDIIGFCSKEKKPTKRKSTRTLKNKEVLTLYFPFSWFSVYKIPLRPITARAQTWHRSLAYGGNSYIVSFTWSEGSLSLTFLSQTTSESLKNEPLLEDFRGIRTKLIILESSILPVYVIHRQYFWSWKNAWSRSS